MVFAICKKSFQTADVAFTLIKFLYVFIGSLLFGGLLGYITAQFIEKVENDRLVETTLTIALALVAFVASEHFFELSGVISTVAAGVVLGNVGRTKISAGVIGFMHELWEYVGFLAISLIFFFAAFELDIPYLFNISAATAVAIGAVLFARAVSVYGTFYLSNHLPGFRDEPNVTMRWQHVLNWGGLRGVIPLVLVYSIPDTFPLKEEFVTFTLACFLFTLFVNATTISWLLKILKLHLPAKEESIIQQEMNIFAIENRKRRLENLSQEDFSSSVIREIEDKLNQEEQVLKQQLVSIATPVKLERSLRLQALEIERQTLEALYKQEHISESVYFDFDAELDLQQDALEYPEVYSGRAFSAGGRVDSQEYFYKHIKKLEQRAKSFPILSGYFKEQRKKAFYDRLAMLQARIFASADVIEYLDHVTELMAGNSVTLHIIDQIRAEHEQLQLKNSLQMQALQREQQKIYQAFERDLIHSYAWAERQSHQA